MKLSTGVVLVFASMLSISAPATVIPSDSDHVVSLDGTWRFKLEQPGATPEHGNIGGKPQPIVTPKNPEPFEKLDYKEDDTWHDIRVPGNWEMAGFSPATY